MRVPIKGVYLQYKGTAEHVYGPLGTATEKVLYVFQRHNDKTCLVSNWQHLRELLDSRPYDIVGAEIEEPKEEIESETKRKPGRPRKYA